MIAINIRIYCNIVYGKWKYCIDSNVNRFIELIVHLNQFTKISLPNALFELYIQCLISTSICLVFCTLNHYC